MINVQKSPTPTRVFRYNDEDIKAQIREDFFILCYICEEYVPKHFDIDHFFPQNSFPHLVHDWDNLFYCCSTCNSIRPKDINTIGNEILNNCKDDVEKNIHLKFDNGRILIILNNIDSKSLNTKKLLNRVYNGFKSSSKSYLYLRKEIEKELVEFEKIIRKYQQNKSVFEQELKDRLSKKTKSLVSAYVSFKRQIVREKYKEFEKYFD